MDNQQSVPIWLAGDPLFHEIWESSLDAMVLSDAAGTVILANPAYFELYAYSPGEVIGCDFAIIFPEPEREAAREAYRAIFESGQPVKGLETVVQRGDGSVRIVESRASFVICEGERHLLSVIRDITMRKEAEQQLHDAQQLLAASQRIMHVGGFEISFATGRIIWSEEVFHIHGLPPTQAPLPSDVLLTYAHPEDRPHLSEHFKQFCSDFISRPIEYRVIRRDGEARVVQAIPRLERDHDGNPARIVGAILDLTDLRRLEDERARLAQVLESTPDLVGIADPLGHVLYLNSAGRRLIGLALDARLEGVHVRQLYEPSIFPIMEAEAIPAALSTGIWRGESLLRSYDGRLIPVSQVIIRHAEDGGKVTHLSTVVRDISAFKEAQEAVARLNRSLEARVSERTAQLAETVQELLEEASARQSVQEELHSVLRFQRAILDSASHAIIATGLDGIIRSFNPAAERMLGYRADQVIGCRSIVSFHLPEELLARADELSWLVGVGAGFQQSLAQPGVIGAQPYEAEWTYRRADGTTLPVAVSLTALRDELGQPEGFLAIVSDISQRRAVEEALRQANLDLARAARLKDEFLANMSHELRTPLNAILGRAEMLQEQLYGPLNERQLFSIQSIEENGRDLLALITDILDIAKIEAGRMELQLDLCDVPTICSASIRMITEVAQKKQIGIALRQDDSVGSLLADQRRLKQILVNLLSNAVKFTPVGGRIGLEVHGDAEAGEVRFVVWDTGIGIAPEDQRHLFQPFVQIDISLSRQYAGTGLGLSLVHRLARLHGGRIELVSTPSKGSRFTVIIPWRTGDSVAPEPAAEPDISQQVGLKAARSVRVLVVDDNQENIDLLREYLEALSYTVVVATSGSEALALATTTEPDLVVMDIQMPGMDGLEAIRHLRAAPVTMQLPIIALSALAMHGDRERCLEAGANEYVSKPVSLKQIVSLIGRYTAPEVSVKSGADGM